MQGRCKEMYRKANEKETTHTGREEKKSDFEKVPESKESELGPDGRI
jgi:hypothetical protein